jgi:hypothetical protein
MPDKDADAERVVGLTCQGKSRAYGFRFSLVDGLVIAICAVATYVAWPAIGSLSLLFPYVLGHFFLFCNVFRIRRQPELIWAGSFVLNFGIWVALGKFGITAPFLAQIPVTVLLIVMECRRPTGEK